MIWKINWTNFAAKQFRKLDKKRQADIIKYLDERVIATDSPRNFGKPLRHNKAGLWRYRVGDMRVICQIKNKELDVLVLAVGHRKNIYNY